MENIEVGEYVRTKYGEIGILTSNYPQLKWKKKINPSLLDFNLIKSHSKNIIDLIEVGDYVNGERVYSVMDYDYKEDEYKKRIVTQERANLGIDHLGIRYYLYEKDIKSIVTKEQFASMQYEIEE